MTKYYSVDLAALKADPELHDLLKVNREYTLTFIDRNRLLIAVDHPNIAFIVLKCAGSGDWQTHEYSPFPKYP